ncbi:MAG: nicotinamide-nucleotide amidohydrolase family protein [Candidatus Omnitrophica bacterium]|nr:nicotinamide-nucleotide amidohydrolase family protein [Candidatus Omnitrophota bacterium]
MVRSSSGVFLLSIGSELLKGEVLNTNVLFLGRVLFEHGMKLVGERSVPDDPAQIHVALREVLEMSDFVITSGGLGPTFDDITHQTLSDYFYGAQESPIKNHVGKAPGIMFRSADRIVIALPGVPREFEAMMLKEVLPKYLVMKRRKLDSFSVKAVGISEVDFLKKLGMLPDPRNVECGIYPSLGEVRFTAVGNNLQALKKKLQSKLKDYIYSFDNSESFEQILGKLLCAKKKTLSVAESCTGGLVTKLLTDIPGSSKYFVGGIIAYANSVKENFANVPKSVLSRYGAVSKEAGMLLAANVRALMNSNYGIGITGIAGPGGGTKQKPVGLVFIAVANSKQTFVEKFQFRGDRERVRLLAAKRAFYLLWHKIKFERF